MNWFAGQKLRHRCREHGHQGGKWWWGGGVMNQEIGIDIYTLIYIKWITNNNLLYKKINKIFKKRIELENHHFDTPNEIMASGSDPHWVLKPLGET